MVWLKILNAGRHSGFLQKSIAMRDEWKIFWREIWRYLRWLPLGLLIALIPFLLSLPARPRSEEMWLSLGVAALYGLIVPLTIMLLFAAVFAVRTQLAIKTGHRITVNTPVYVLVNAVGMALGVWLAMWIAHHLFGFPMAGAALLSGLTFGGLIVVVFAFHFAYQQQRAQTLTLRAQAAEASYHTLATQMRPHFLFNALNSLAELIESKQEHAAETAYQLSDLYRHILASAGKKTAPLSQELEIVKTYLELEQLRFGARLQFTINAPAESESIYLPSLMLQTLVENAIKHGIAPSVEGGQVLIEIKRAANDFYHLSVINTGRRYQPLVTSNGTGLANTRARLELLYGARSAFSIGCDEQGRTVASFKFTGEPLD
jgi:signal transduction histidine kinase